jgi:hypothetical protein
MKNSSQQLVYGSFETVMLPAFSTEPYIAKVDTGAYSGAIHCSLLKETVKDGRKVLQFRPLTGSTIHETKRYIQKFVRSSTGHRVSRYLINTDIIIRGEKYKVRIGLSDRADMQYEILIGRRFLREHGIIVDVRINQELDKGNGTII